MNKILVFIFLLATSFTVMAQESFSSVEERMTGREFMDAGLAKLTDSELEALNRWLRDHSVATMESRSITSGAPIPSTATTAAPSGSVASTPLPADDRRGFEGQDDDKTIIVSPIIGEFKGWDGETVFKLQNGMIWKQSEMGRQITKLLINPVVTIKPGMFNSWNLTVEGYNRNVQVKRVQ